MPTGCTAAIKDGISFREYALNCARAFSALITMRDDPYDAKIPKIIVPSDYHTKKIIEIKEKLNRIKKLSLKECNIKSKKTYEQDCKSIDKNVADIFKQEEKYRKMLVLAKAYTPPSKDHIKYAEFMVKQIEESIKFDCSTDYLKYPEFVDGITWKNNKIKQLQKDLIYQNKKNLKEIECAENRTVWIQKMFKSLENYR